MVVFLISSYHKAFLKTPTGRKSAVFLTLFLLCGRKNIRIPSYFLPSKIYRVGSSQILGYTSYHQVESIAVFLETSYHQTDQPNAETTAGRRSVQKGLDLLPRGEALARNIDSSPPPWGGTCQKYGQFSSPAGRHLPEIWTILLHRGSKAFPQTKKKDPQH